MDIFAFYPQYQVLVCKRCAYAVAPKHLASHIKTKHPHEACHDAGLHPAHHRVGRLALMLAKRLQTRHDLLDPAVSKIPVPLPTERPLSDLKLYRGIQCSRCEYLLTKTKHTIVLMGKHFNQHRLLPRKPGRQSKIADIPEADKGPMFTDVYCQRFFTSGPQSSFFAVHVPTVVQELKGQPQLRKADLLRAIINEQLDASNGKQQVTAQTYTSQTTKTEVSPWLELTRWPRFFDGLDMTEVAPLAYLPNPRTEPGLAALGESFDRIIEQAYLSICEDRISVFDQAKINSFISDRSSKQERLIMVKLQKGTFRVYKGLWKRLLCFTYRTSLPSQKIPLLHRFTSNQLCALDKAMTLAEELLALKGAGKDD
ncbi:hypothetical protein BU24DRAFT_360180, partial [Aaosphaeria arxii CBS 175.79]